MTPIARVLVTRPEALGRETAARLAALGHAALLSPLLEPRALAWEPPQRPFDCLWFTSPQAPALGGPGLARYRHLPAYVRGDRTAEAARDAGFATVHVGAPVGRVLHLCGEDVTPDTVAATRVAVYAAGLVPLTDEAVAELRAGRIDRVLLFSTRTAAHFAAECDRHRLDRAAIAIAAISAKALAAAGAGWRDAVAATAMTDAGVLAAAGLLCDKRGT